VVVVAVVALGANYYTMYRPVRHAKGRIAKAVASRHWRAAEAECLGAARADPWWSEPWEILAELAYRRWLYSPSPEARRVFEQAVSQALKRHPRSSRLHHRHGDWLMNMHAIQRDPLLAQQATRAYEQAVRLYPHSNLLHAQLAWAYHLCGRAREAQAHAKEALALDSLTPHQELKLAQQRLVDGYLRPDAPGQGMSAEQMMVRLRKVNNR
jgi:tetratricopeptide (TPR) repeat protein